MLSSNNNLKNDTINSIGEFNCINESLYQIIKTANKYDAHMSKFIEMSLEDYLKSDTTQDYVVWVYQDILMTLIGMSMFLVFIPDLEINKNKFDSNLYCEASTALGSVITKWSLREEYKNDKDLENSRFFRLVISTMKKILSKNINN